VGGPLGIMFAVVVAGAGLRIALTALAVRNTERAESIRRVVHAAGLFGTVLLGMSIAAVTSAGGPSIGTRTVAAVQGGGQRGTSAQQVNPVSVTQAQLAALAQVPSGTALTVLPEDVVGLDGPLAGSWQEAALASAATRLATTLLAGVTTPVGTAAFNNFVVAYGPSGEYLGRVEKVHRVPFGEYVPARSLVARFASVGGVPRDAVVGTAPEVLHTPAGVIGVLISFEVFFADRSAEAVAHGATLLVVPTNTTSYPTSQMPGQELAAARLQAVERGRNLVQASPTGYSALIDNLGNVTQRSALSTRGVVAGTVSLHRGATLFTTVGSWPVPVVAACFLVLGQLRARKRPTAKDSDREAAAHS